MRGLATAGVGLSVALALACCQGASQSEAPANDGGSQEAAQPLGESTADDDALGEDYWLSSSLWAEGNAYGPCLTAASLTEDELSLQGTARIGDAEDAVELREGDWSEERSWTFAVTDATVFEGSNPQGPNQPYSFEEAKAILESLNGLGVDLHVERGVVTCVRFVS